MVFYATVVTVFSLMFIVLMVQLWQPSGGDDDWTALVVSARAWPREVWRYLALAALGMAFELAVGMVIPMAVLAGFLADRLWWRALAFAAVIVMVIAALGNAVMALFRGAVKAGEVVASFNQGPEEKQAVGGAGDSGGHPGTPIV